MRASKKADWREERRKRAWKLKEKGWQQKDIAEALGGSSGAVSQWLKQGRAGGLLMIRANQTSFDHRENSPPSASAIRSTRTTETG